MKIVIKKTYEFPEIETITLCTQDLIMNSFDPFFGEEDSLKSSNARGYTSIWQEK